MIFSFFSLSPEHEKKMIEKVVSKIKFKFFIRLIFKFHTKINKIMNAPPLPREMKFDEVNPSGGFVIRNPMFLVTF